MRVRILNHDAYGDGTGSVWMPEYEAYLQIPYAVAFPLGSVHEVEEFYPDTGEIDLVYEGERVTFAPSEYEVVEE